MHLEQWIISSQSGGRLGQVSIAYFNIQRQVYDLIDSGVLTILRYAACCNPSGTNHNSIHLKVCGWVFVGLCEFSGEG